MFGWFSEEMMRASRSNRSRRADRAAHRERDRLRPSRPRPAALRSRRARAVNLAASCDVSEVGGPELYAMGVRYSVRTSMASVFISYRRGDASGYAGRLREALERRLGAGQVFRDAEAIRPGQDFVQAIDAQVSGCAALLALS